MRRSFDMDQRQTRERDKGDQISDAAAQSGHNERTLVPSTLLKEMSGRNVGNLCLWAR
jgi:hypothetical protein